MSIILVNATASNIPIQNDMIHSHCTSPPYWRQRDYSHGGADQTIYWPKVTYQPSPGQPPIAVRAGWFELGMEPTPELFIAHLVLVYREVYRVTRSDSSGWCIVGDCFWDSNRRRATREERPLQQGEEDGQLVGIPAMLFKALQADGWIVRNDCVFAKTNPMPESVAGTRYERHRIKIAPGRPPANQGHLPDDGQRPGGNRCNQWGDVGNQPNAEWCDCPGCVSCEQQPADCPDCRGTGVVFPDPDLPTTDEEHRAYCEANPCLKCGGSGKYGGYVLRRGSWRHTRAHETVLHLVKSMGYWSDQEAVREKWADNRMGDPGPATTSITDIMASGNRRFDHDTKPNVSGRNPRSVLTSPAHDESHGNYYKVLPSCPEHGHLLNPQSPEVARYDEQPSQLESHNLDTFENPAEEPSFVELENSYVCEDRSPPFHFGFPGPTKYFRA